MIFKTNINVLFLKKEVQKWTIKGYGKSALMLALDFIKTWPCGVAELCWISYEPENVVAKHLYASFGFVETGKMCDDELVAVLKL